MNYKKIMNRKKTVNRRKFLCRTLCITFLQKCFLPRGEIGKLGGEIKAYGSKVLLVYGGGSIKKIGLYDRVVNHFK